MKTQASTPSPTTPAASASETTDTAAGAEAPDRTARAAAMLAAGLDLAVPDIGTDVDGNPTGADAPEGDPAVASGDAAAAAAVQAAKPADPAAAAAAQVSPQLAAIARRERELQRASTERETKLAAREKELEGKLAQVELVERAAAMAKADPVALFKALGIKDGFAEIGELLYFEAMGDKAPPELAERKRQRALDERMAAIEAREQQAAEREQRATQAAADERLIAGYKTQIRGVAVPKAGETLKVELAGADGKPEHRALPHVQALAEELPDQLVDALYEMAARKAEADPTAKPPTPAELAAELEENLKRELAPFRKLYPTPADKPSSANKPAAPDAKPAPTLSNEETDTHTSRKSRRDLTPEERIERAARLLEQQ